MKMTIKLCELNNILRVLRKTKFILSTENQREFKLNKNINAEIIFNDIFIFQDIKSVYFKGDLGVICIKNINYIEYNTNESVIGDVMRIVCHDKSKVVVLTN